MQSALVAAPLFMQSYITLSVVSMAGSREIEKIQGRDNLFRDSEAPRFRLRYQTVLRYENRGSYVVLSRDFSSHVYKWYYIRSLEI